MKKHILWLTAVAILVIIYGTIYTVTQHSQRMNANWPQIQIAEDTAVALNAGTAPDNFSAGRVNLNSSLAPFTIIYDKSGNAISGNGYLNGHLPQAPIGILQRASGRNYHFVTWQPQSDVRIAAVTVAADKYYVLSGRSLKEVESNATQTLELALLGGLLSIIVLGTGYALTQKRAK